MRVLHLLTTLDRGGAESQVSALCRTLALRGRVQPEVAYLKGDGELAPDLLAAGIPVARVGQASPWRVLRILRERRPDVLHTHLFKADIHGALLAGRASIQALVSTKHNEDPHLRRPLGGALGRMAARRAGAVVAISGAVERFVREALDLPEGKVRVVRYGLDPDRLPRGDGAAFRESLGVPADAPLAVAVARLDPQKGLEVLVEAAARLRARLPAARFVLAGRGPSEAALRDRVRARGLQGRVIFAGFLDDPGPAYAAADCVVLPSLWEGFGLAALEARAAGRPVVVSSAGGLPEAAGQDGAVVPPGDAGALADALEAALAPAAIARVRSGELAGGIRQRALEEFPLSRAAEAHEALYEELLGGGSKAPASAPAPAAARAKRVLLVARAGTGGAARHVRMLVERLDRTRFEPVVAASPVEDPRFPAAIEALGARVIPVPIERDPAPLRDLASFHAVRDLVRSGEFDLVHAHTSKPGAFARLAAAKTGTPVLYTPHGWAFTYAGGETSRAMFLHAERALAKRGGLVHCVSDGEADLAAAQGVVPPDRLRVVPNAVPAPAPSDAEHLAVLREELGIREGETVALMAARLAPPKDPLAFLDAARRIGESAKARFLLAGDGPLFEECRQARAPRVSILGARDDVADLLAIADVAVLATRYDSCPYFALEAAAAGKPIVAPADFVPGGLLPGLVPYDPADPDSLTRVLGRLLGPEGADRRAVLRAAARRAWEAEFTPERWIQRMHALYEEAAAG